ncbi:hypothetical protein [Microbulbifer sp. TYP-18]|uniref:hypothetical protein n=1 Tax=Microbulbifer sp. TYP-18 TaxID=3230024 RepID=UPI0034C5C906
MVGKPIGLRTKGIDTSDFEAIAQLKTRGLRIKQFTATLLRTILEARLEKIDKQVFSPATEGYFDGK